MYILLRGKYHKVYKDKEFNGYYYKKGDKNHVIRNNLYKYFTKNPRSHKRSRKRSHKRRV